MNGLQRSAIYPAAEVGEVASGFKIAAHQHRVHAYLRGEAVFPICLELDLTSRCSRTCPDCPSSRAAVHWHLDRAFLDRLFGILAGQTRGLLLTGGEPTLSPLFTDAVSLARRRGIAQIAVVTNGSQLDEPAVVDALLAHVSTIRLSLYDWEADGNAATTLARLERLRQCIEREQSPLQLGLSVLTSRKRVRLLGNLVAQAANAGAHWIYFHPRCRNWDQGKPQPEDQAGVLSAIGRLRDEFSGVIDVQVSTQRYEASPLEFSGYHAAHFMIVIGADRKNYLGAEVKYNASHLIADLGDGFADDFLWRQPRLDRIAAVTSRTYQALASRHRGVLYSTFLERLLRRDDAALTRLQNPPRFRFSHIL